jgi:hypothetical protein
VTGAPFGEVDLDLLADHAAGVLDEAESRRVVELIESDPRWAHAHRALVAADAAVSEQLRAAGQVDVAMPDDIAARLDAALDGAHGSAGGIDAPVVSLVGRGAGDGKGRRLVVTLPRLAAAAAVIGVLLLGLPALGGLLTQSQMDAGPTSASDSNGYAANRESGQMAAPAAPTSAALDIAAGATVIFSGANYSRSSLKALSRNRVAIAPDLATDAAKTVPAPTLPSIPPYAAQSATSGVGGATGLVPAELARLLDPVALHACVAAVEAATPGTVATVEFARYEGRPALIVTVDTAPSGARTEDPGVTAVVVGPACGVAGPDRIAATDQD